MNLPAVLAGNFEVSDAATVCKKKKDVLWRSRVTLACAGAYHDPAANCEQGRDNAR
jgi:hypothetical protein